jgi:hypothetical protein
MRQLHVPVERQRVGVALEETGEVAGVDDWGRRGVVAVDLTEWVGLAAVYVQMDISHVEVV